MFWVVSILKFLAIRIDQESFLARSLSIYPVLQVLKWNARSGQNDPAHVSQLLSSPAPVGKSAGVWRIVAGKMCAHLGPFPHLNWSEPVLCGRSEWTNGKQIHISNFILQVHAFFIRTIL